MPETAAGRALATHYDLFKSAAMVSKIDTIEAEARALGRAEAREAVRAAVDGLDTFMDEMARPDDRVAVYRSDVLAAIDNLEPPHA